jgi:hypothetical protein
MLLVGNPREKETARKARTYEWVNNIRMDTGEIG